MLDHYNCTVITETFIKGDNGKTHVKTYQNVDKILDANKQDMNANIGQGWKGDFHKVASVPWVVAIEWRNELIRQGASNPDPFHQSNKKYLIAKLNSSDFSNIRTKGGKL